MNPALEMRLWVQSDNPDYQDVVKKLTNELVDLRIKYKDSEDLDRSFLYD